MEKTEVSKPKPLNYHMTTYTREQKIVAAVWHHERIFTGMTRDQLKQNFLVRFKLELPKCTTLKRWEQQLFRDGYLHSKHDKKRTTLARLVHVPYVKESLVRYPDITMRTRARLLGISETTLILIFKQDLKESDLSNIKNANEVKDSIDDSNDTPEVKIEYQDVGIKSEVFSTSD